ncbi:MAG: hypothetical protein IJ708_12355, partial [Clostridia bacterium]|nr:hypothetical protein [Clostridia bacterium]
VVATTTSSSTGSYQFELPIGNYTVIAEKPEFTSSYFNIVVLPNQTKAGQNHAMIPIATGNEYRIKLTWGQNPRDLDSHLQGKDSVGNSYHVYYGDKNAYDNGVLICNLDVDDTNGEGPENVTFTIVNTAPYYYYIHHYAGSSNISASGAKIEVYQGNALIRTFNVPTGLGYSNYWNVFAIVNGNIVVRNTMSDEPEVSYAN